MAKTTIIVNASDNISNIRKKFTRENKKKVITKIKQHSSFPVGFSGTGRAKKVDISFKKR